MSRNTRIKWAVVLAAFCLLHLLIFTRVFYSGGPDVDGYYNYASRMALGQVAYRDFPVEYPPGALVVFYLPQLFSHDITSYGVAFTVEMLIFDVLGLFLVLGLGRRARISPWTTLIGYTLAMVAIGSIAVQRFDMVPAVITLGAVYAFARGNFRIAWVVLALGTMTKLFPALLAPIFLIYQWRKSGLLRTLPSLATFAVVILGISLPLLAVSPHGFLNSFIIQEKRPLQLESTYSSLLLVAASLGLGHAYPIQGAISFDLSSPLAWPLARASFIFTGAGLGLAYGFYYRACRRLKCAAGSYAPEASDLADILNYAFAALVVLLVTTKVFSPQYLVWLYPFFPLVSGRLRPAVWVVFLTAACLTWYIYPLHYYDLLDTQAVPVDALFLRNVFMISLAVLLIGEKAPPTLAEPETAPLELETTSV